MKTILITDTHFGIKQNSAKWLNSQLEVFYKQIIPCIEYLKNEDDVRVIHCGDVFDSRNIINPFIASKVKKLFKDLAKLCPVYIVLGNHDFYSPVDSTISVLDLILSDINNLYLIKDKIEILYDDFDDSNCSLLAPWYEFNNFELLKNYISEYKPKKIFCHTDLINISDQYKELLKDISVYSGHIHTPNKNKNLYTLGSMYALTFADANESRGFYVLDDNTDELKYVESKNIIKFYRFYNEEIFTIDANNYKNDYIEVFIDKANLMIESYVKIINELSKKIKNISFIPNILEIKSHEILDFNNFNISDFCKQYIPEKLKDKFDFICKK